MNYHVELIECMYKIKNIHFQKLLPFEITHGECFALFKLKELSEQKEDGKVTVSELNSLIDVSAPALSRTIKNLEGDGFISRTEDANDRRNNFLSLTDKGKNIICDAEKRMRKCSENVLEKMGEERLKEFITFMNDFYLITSEEINKLQEGD